jgi:hypothetical protein
MKNKTSFLVPIFAFFCFSLSTFANVGAIAGSNIFEISGGSSAAPTWKIVSASSVGDSVYTGVVDSFDDNNDRISFATSLDENNETIYPFFASGVFNPDVQIPELTVSLSGSSVSSISASYGTDGYQSTRTGFDNAPEIVVSSGEGNQSTATCSLTSGEITSFTVTNGGSEYSSAPEARVVGGPHLVRITDTSSDYYGRVFLITNNTQTTLDLDFSIVAQGETAEPSTYFPAGTAIEVVPAATLGSIFGISSSSLPTNWSTAANLGDSSSSDWVYIWDYSKGGYMAHHFVNGTTLLPDGWYRIGNGRPKNNLVIYPDEAFIVSKRTSGDVTLEVEGEVSTEDQKLYLPASGDQMVANNPFGMDLLLAELIPSTSISSDNTASDYNKKFRPGASSSTAAMDTITIYSGGQWKKYWYDSSKNSTVTEMMQANARAGSGSSNAITASDLFIGSGSISDVETCTSASGSGPTTNGTDGNWTKISASGITRDLTGFTISISGIQGYMLNAEGTHEVNATTGENIDSNGTSASSIVYSNISGSYEVVGGGSGYVVIEKQRDINFKSNEGTPAWVIGDLGTGYGSSANWWAVGGNNGTTDSNASGTVSTSGSFTVSAGGSGYTSAPQIVISGGGWTDVLDASGVGNQLVGASDGFIISRRATGGVRSFIEAVNPSGN